MHAENITTLVMGSPVTTPHSIPVLHTSTPSCVGEPFMVNGEIYRVTALSFGTPHGAVLVEDIDSVDVETLGAALGTHARFPKGASIVFFQVYDKNSIKVRLWQRAIGETPLTPEAVCVAGTAAKMLKKIHTGDVRILMGDYSIQVNCNTQKSE